MNCLPQWRQEAKKTWNGFYNLVLVLDGPAFTISILLLSLIVVLNQSTASAAPPPLSQASNAPPSKWINQLPDGNGKTIIVKKCQFCHTLEQVVTSKRSNEEWKDLIDEMKERGARLTVDESQTVIDYLTANFGAGPSNRPKASNQRTIPPADNSTAIQTSMASLIVDPDRVSFSPVPEQMGLPSDVEVFTISGDPLKTEPFSMLLKLPAGQIIPPRSLPADEDIVCLKGILEFAEGDSFDPAKLQPLETGVMVHVPAHVQHFALAKNMTIILVYGAGPFSAVNSK
jgi:quercetin dioxygenase-like cupin family protein